MPFDDDIGRKTIGDTHTHVDFPYRCKRCGKYINIVNRLREDHDCIPTKKKSWYGIFSSKQQLGVVNRPIKETYAKGYKHRVVNSPFRRFVNWLKSLF